MIGKTLAHYEITAELGKGGMGEVWRARDTKLGREVAIKTLPEEFARDVDRLARFEREAKLLASLNHPNIASIHGFDEDKGTHFLVLELVEGDTLAERIARGPIPVDDSLDLALQIAAALEAAHQEGVIHRDLKPGNIKITPDGKVKVLDFGLAKALTGDAPGANQSQSPTLSMAATAQGVILGTAAYMSPEQARGVTIDKRADVWAFGCVLYEMLTGRQVFAGELMTDVMASVLKSDPNYQGLPPATPARVRALLNRCLQKDPKQRWHDVGDMRVEIEQAMAHPEELAYPAASERRTPPLAWAAAIVGAVALTAAMMWLLTSSPPAGVTSIVRFDQELPVGHGFSNLTVPSVTVSPDGTRIVYVANNTIYVRSLDETEPRELVSVSGQFPEQPFFSPDGEWIGYHASLSSEIRKVPSSGGTTQLVASGVAFGTLLGASWGPNDTIVYASFDGIRSVDADGGQPVMIIPSPPGERPRDPELLPDGQTVIYVAEPATASLTGQIRASRPGSQERDLGLVGRHPRYLPTGHLVFASAGDLMAVAFDADTLEVFGSPLVVVEDVRMFPAHFGISDLGILAYLAGTQSDLRLIRVDPDGGRDLVDYVTAAEYNAPRVAPDGAILVWRQDLGDLWIWETDGRNYNLTNDGLSSRAIWSPDGSEIAYTSNRSGENIWIQRDDLSAPARQVTFLDTQSHVDSWSPDGQTLAFHHHAPDGQIDLYTVELTEGAEPTAFLTEDYRERVGVFSPDGRYMAFVSDRSGQDEIWVTAFPDGGRQVPISAGGGTQPLWARTGELYYRNQAGDRMMEVEITTDPGLEVGESRVVFEGFFENGPGGPYRNYDITDDGQFLMVGREGDDRPRISVVLNWFEDLRRRVPFE